MTRSYFILSLFLLLCVQLSGCTVFSRFVLVNEHSMPIHVVGTLIKDFADSLSKSRWYLEYHKDGDPRFRDTIINGEKLKVADLAPGDEILLGGARNIALDSSFLIFERLEITDTTGKRSTLPTRKAIYERCSKTSSAGQTSKLVYTGE